MRAKFKKTLVLSDFDVVNTNVKSGVYNKVLKLTVPAQQMITWGTGGIVGGVDDRGIVYIDFKDSSDAQIKGWVRLALADANEINKVVVFEERIERLSATKTDRTKAYFLGEYSIKAKEDSQLIIEFKPDSDATVDTSKSDVSVPVTVYYV